MMDGTYTAVVDRIVDGETAVVLIEEDGDVVEEYNLAVEELPTEADEGGVLEVRIDHGEVVQMDYSADETAARRQSAQDRFDQLSERLSDS